MPYTVTLSRIFMFKKIAIALSFASLSAFGAAQSFNIDFGFPSSASAPPSSTYAAAGLAGFWNNLVPTGAAFNFSNMGGLDGNATDVGLSTTISSVTSTVTGGFTADDRALLQDWWNISSPLSISGLDAGSYDIILYGNSFDPSTFTIGQQTQSLPSLTWTGAHVEGGTYVRFSGVQLDGLSSLLIGNQGGVSGMQIVFNGSNPVPEPFTMTLLGAAALAGYRRVRKNRQV